MNYYIGNIEKQTLKNKVYRKIVFTSKNMQLVFMSIPVNSEIGLEKHKKSSQFIRIESGKGMAIIGKHRHRIKSNSALLVPPNKNHNIINTGKAPLKLYTIYTPPAHKKN